ncbi:MAG: hypothetical protein ACTHWI_08785 [Alkalibacterium gilvum]|uniref:Rgg family transcriptional regulator n=1 Tax=Alkalibacterium gilvum TaxID=1130080 RepID=UPI003F8E5BE4
MFFGNLLLLLYKQTKIKLENFSLLRKYNNEVFSLLLNILVVFIKKDDVKMSAFFYEELKNSVFETTNTMYEKTMMIFLKELINIMKSKNYNERNIEKIISLFSCLF